MSRESIWRRISEASWVNVMSDEFDGAEGEWVEGESIWSITKIIGRGN